MKKELLLELLPDAVTSLIEKNYDDIARDMQRTFDEGDPEKAFKFPVGIKLVLMPSGEKSRFSLEASWSVKKSRKGGEYVMDESGQQDLFKQKKEANVEEVEVVEESHQIEAPKKRIACRYR